MLFTRIHSAGLAVDCRADDLDARPALGDASLPAADALSLWCAGLAAPDAQTGASALDALAWRLPGSLHAEECWSELDPDVVRATLAADTLDATVEVSIAPDPPLYGRLREHALRDARLVSALGQEAELHVKVGWRVTRDRATATYDLLGARIGDVAFPIAGADVPPWLRPLLADVARRVHRVDLEEPWARVVSRLSHAALAPTAPPRAAWRRLVAAATALGLAEPQLVLGPRLAFGDALLDARGVSRDQRDIIRSLEATLVRAPDVLVLPERLPDAALAWVRARTEGDDATLEQVLTP
jgi:hypothetical protein